MLGLEQNGLTDGQVQNFIDDGFVRIENAFSAELARQCVDELWEEISLSPDEPESWTQPVIRVGAKSSAPFVEAANTQPLHKAYDQLVGEGRWLPPKGLGTFPIRFPWPESPGDDGWHVDMSFGASPDFMEWRANVKSSGRALLMLFLFSDVGPDDAPTRTGRDRMPPLHGNCFRMAKQVRRSGNYQQTDTLRQRIASLNWQRARRAPSICAIHSSSTPHNLTEERGRASWRNHRCCQKASSIRPCRLLQFR